jgi:hypothetical protein
MQRQIQSSEAQTPLPIVRRRVLFGVLLEKSHACRTSASRRTCVCATIAIDNACNRRILAPAKAKATTPATPSSATPTSSSTGSPEIANRTDCKAKFITFANLGRDGAEALLAKADDNTFLVRKSTSEARCLGAIGPTCRWCDSALACPRAHRFSGRTWRIATKKLVEEYSVDIGGVIRTFPSVEFLADELDLNPLELDEDDSAFELAAAAAAPASSDGNKSPRRIRRDVGGYYIC